MAITIDRVEAIPARVPFRESFVIGSGAVGSAGSAGQHVFVRLETNDGAVGWGEVRALPSWSFETVESITGTIRGYLAPLLIGRSPFEVNRISASISERLAPAVSHGHPFARAAVEIALHDLAGRLAGVPVHALLGGKVRDRVPLTYALSIDAPEAMAAAAAGARECSSFKVKIAGDVGLDLERVRAVAAARPDAELWLDANQSYSPARLSQLLGVLPWLPRLFCIEQPVRSADWFGLRQARERSPLPLAVDEGCFSAFDVARLARMDAAELVVLKVCKSGGLRECLRSAAVAEANGMGLLGSGLTESGVGFTASVHLFATLPTLLPPELNGVQFLESMWAAGLRLEGAEVLVPDAPGLGIEVDEEAIRAHALEA
jgi:muconate cycloisomerase